MSTILEEAAAITSGDRQKTYGDPATNHSRTARLWNAWLAVRGFDVDLTPEDVCWLNVLQKMSRQAHLPKRDNLVDVVGYTENITRMSSGQHAENEPDGEADEHGDHD